ncbi:MAG: thermonuclease family protein [Gemmatimonadales bacterium]
MRRIEHGARDVKCGTQNAGRRGRSVPLSATRVVVSVVSIASVVCAALAAQVPRDSAGPPAPVRATTACTLTRVVDGDTIACAGMGRVRLIGMDTPEASQRPFGAMATRALAALLDSAATIALEPDVEPRDRYGRTLAYVWADSVMVNWAMVRRGYAVVLTYAPNVQWVDWFTAAQRAAREEEAGLWAVNGFECLPIDRRRGRC